jgi:ATP-dependent RNA helicase DeaD
MEELLTRHAQRFFCVLQHGYLSLHFIITFLYMPKKATTELEVLETSTQPILDDSATIDSTVTDDNTSGFEKFWLREWVLRGLEKAWYTVPTQIQEQVIDRFIHGNHIVGQSQTGTGKTAAFVIPLINAIDPRSRKLQAIIMAPTRELVVQTEEEFYKLAWGSAGFKSAAAYGGWSKYRQLSQLERGAQVLVATPGRLLDYISTGKISTADVKYFVLDEADRMLDMWFQDDIEDIISACPNVDQIMSFSATITPELNRIITRYVGTEYDFIKAGNGEIVVDKIDHSFVHVNRIDKMDMLDKYLKEHDWQKVIIFTQTKMGADEVAEALYKMWHKVAAIHGDIDQRNRMRTIKDLKSDYLKILVATDVAARGLNLNDIELVVNYEVPQDPESYVHRIGRTARAGKSGKAITFADGREFDAIKMIERRNKLTIKQVDQEGVVMERRVIDNQRDGSGSRFGGNRRRWGGNGRFGGDRRPARTGRFGDDARSSDDRGGFRGGDRGGFASRSDRPSYGDKPQRSFGWDRGDDRGGYSSSRDGDRVQSSGWFRSGRNSSRDINGGARRTFGWDRSQSRGPSRGGDRPYRYNDSQEAGARSGEYSAPKKDNQMFVPRNKYY